jgi:hypothetical protein
MGGSDEAWFGIDGGPRWRGLRDGFGPITDSRHTVGAARESALMSGNYRTARGNPDMSASAALMSAKPPACARLPEISARSAEEACVEVVTAVRDGPDRTVERLPQRPSITTKQRPTARVRSVA